MARDEPDCAKRAKLDALQLSDDKWERVTLFLSLLKVCLVYVFDILCLLIFYCSDNISTLTQHSKHFLPKVGQHYTLHCPHWRPCTMHGYRAHGQTNTINLRLH